MLGAYGTDANGAEHSACSPPAPTEVEFMAAEAAERRTERRFGRRSSLTMAEADSLPTAARPCVIGASRAAVDKALSNPGIPASLFNVGCSTPAKSGKRNSGNPGDGPWSGIQCNRPGLPWHCLNFLPDPQGHGSLRPTLFGLRTGSRRTTLGRVPCAICLPRCSSHSA